MAAKLHNFVINNDGLQFDEQSTDITDFGVEALVMEDGTTNNRSYLPTLPTRVKEEVDGGSRRSLMLENIVERDMRRTIHNLLQNQELDDDTVYEIE